MKNIIIFASGAGTNAQQIIRYFRHSDKARVRLIVCNNPKAGVLAVAAGENIPSVLIDREKFYHTDEYVKLLQSLPADLIVLAGFLWKVPDNLLHAFPDKIINIHPALLPKYGGKGMYGHHVHAAVIASGDAETGMTIHYVNEKYDEGKIILQKSCPVETGDTPETLAHKVQQLEHRWFPAVVASLLVPGS